MPISTNQKRVVREKLTNDVLHRFHSRFELPPAIADAINETEERNERTQRDSNPRPTAPQAAILSKLNYGPNIFLSLSSNIYMMMPMATIAVTATFPSSRYLN
jgi:hypothetical protein